MDEDLIILIYKVMIVFVMICVMVFNIEYV